MVTIRQHRAHENTTINLITLDGPQQAADFLDRLAADYIGIPGFKANRTPDALTITACAIGGTWETVSTYTTKES